MRLLSSIGVLFLGITFFLIGIGSNSIRTKRALAGQRWPSNDIPYAFSDQFDEHSRNKIQLVLTEIERLLTAKGRSCVHFVPKTMEKEYISFVDKNECSSSGVGFIRGINEISLAKECLMPGTIMHEIVHQLGFDHEHSRFDRDMFVDVNTDNVRGQKHNFDINKKNAEHYEQSPYDFLSITHYNSNALQIDKTKANILSKIPALISKENKLNFERNTLSKIDILQIQKLYECNEIVQPWIRKAMDFSELEETRKINDRFTNEAIFSGISEELVEKYLEKTTKTCGIEHYWHMEYPLVESEHKHYLYVCEKKKLANQYCRFSIECQGEDSSCIRLFFRKHGFCLKTKYAKLNAYGQKINDVIFQKGQVVKEEAKVNKEKLNSVVSSSVDLVKSSFSSLKRIFG